MSPVGPVKRLVDLVLCVVALPVVLPVAAVVAVAVRLGGPGTILYRARRVGLNGAPIVVLKFRTMAPDRAGPAVTSAVDPRITVVGRVLRATKLDELPQLLNVLRGDMSLVGPRPEDPRYVALYDAEQRAVLTVRPGVTGLGSLAFRDEQGLIAAAAPADAETFYVQSILPEKLRIERRYVEDWSIRRDLTILVRTVGVVLS
jgi:lipopolysaccharide/colanic/teichoic acid biosynthesis glycosyltransferase